MTHQFINWFISLSFYRLLTKGYVTGNKVIDWQW